METEKKNVLYALAKIAAQNADCRKEYMERLGKGCRVLAQGMQLSPAFEGQVSDTFIDAVELAASLCDIGNIAIPREILRKKEGLTAEEEETLRTHTDIGADIVKELYVSNDYNDFIGISVDVIRRHHEKWDGSGYPDGLRGEEIPLAAQIVSVMEDYCMLTEQGACDREEALRRMAQEAGKKYNPDIFKICSKISRQLG
ncbi:MAG: HD domain-containing protein [Lachnospiraceae bacterium]|nr:HD domain-containing protein [Lachnospiraceae bacterium]